MRPIEKNKLEHSVAFSLRPLLTTFAIGLLTSLCFSSHSLAQSQFAQANTLLERKGLA